jgi:hypothetical protein
MKSQKGRLKVDPATGEKRITLTEIGKPKRAADEIVLTLAQILHGTVRMESGDDKRPIRIKPMNLNSLATLQDLYEEEGGFEILAKRAMTLADYRRIATVLANQDLSPGETPLTEDDIGRLVDAENYGVLVALIGRAMAPFNRALEFVEATPTPTASLVGTDSSITVLKSSVGSPNKSGGLHSRRR